MKAVFFKILLLAMVVLSAALVQFAQPETKDAPGKVFVGESAKYEARFSKLISFSIAELTITASLAPNGNDLIINGDAVSKGTLIKIARFSFLQNYVSTVDLKDFRILKTTKHDVQKERVRDSEAIFDYGQKRVTYVETDPKDANRPPRRIASDIDETMHDISSAIFAMRLLPLVVGKRFELPVSDSGVVYRVPIAVTGRELIKTAIGKVWCVRVEPEVFGPGRLIEQKGKLVIWVTDDDRRIPVKAQIDASIGKVEIKIKEYKKTP
ncbi:MAG: DUF3108 domain-containing protein [Chloracidobacterium sp.]|nr:DUF3108 domain-containing protein [Chloracidobacterium sp.]